jgi:hypothetical protein
VEGAVAVSKGARRWVLRGGNFLGQTWFLKISKKMEANAEL